MMSASPTPNPPVALVDTAPSNLRRIPIMDKQVVINTSFKHDYSHHHQMIRYSTRVDIESFNTELLDYIESVLCMVGYRKNLYTPRAIPTISYIINKVVPLSTAVGLNQSSNDFPSPQPILDILEYLPEPINA